MCVDREGAEQYLFMEQVSNRSETSTKLVSG